MFAFFIFLVDDSVQNDFLLAVPEDAVGADSALDAAEDGAALTGDDVAGESPEVREAADNKVTEERVAAGEGWSADDDGSFSSSEMSYNVPHR